MTFEYGDTSFTSNPPIQQMISEPLAFKILHYKAKTLHSLFDQTQDLRYLDAALDAAKVATELVEKSRQEIVTQGSKQKLAGDALGVYETGIEIALALQEEKGGQQYLEEAFAFAESNKAILLLESINETVAKSYGGIPDSLLEQEKDQRINIAFYEKEIYQERQKEEADEEKLELWENQLFEYKQDYQALVKRLEEEFPEYYEMKYNTRLASLSDLQERVIKDGEVLVEYFVGAEKIYVFVVSKGAAEVIALEKAENYEVPIFALRDAILEVDNGVQFYQAILSKSSELHDLYFAPIAGKLPAGTERILLVTDDALGYLPFEVLLRKHPRLADQDITFSPEVLEYLFEDYLINYHYSSTLLEKSYEFEPKEELQPLFAMAPSFASPLAQANRACSSDQLYSLHCSKDEASAINDLYGGSMALGEEANKLAFFNQAPDFRILHLATHSCADEENPNLSQIYFNDGGISNYELFNLDLNAELAVLSACNTGSGKLVQGEGVMSLSKGFIHAGVPSTVMSLWAVDDCSTSKLMVLFYEFLKQGLPKDEALRQARLAYLNASDPLNQHPYFWAPFIQMGNSMPINMPRSGNTWLWFAMGVGVLGLGLAWMQRSRKMAA
ncbi:MAG: CHAT domain-containing protein [Bacteroidota bacterium]